VSDYSPLYNATITGNVQSYSNIILNAGGSAIFASTANVAADNALLVRTGDDIIVQAGALVSSTNNPTTAVDAASPFASGPNLGLQAGSITNLSLPILTPISSVVVAGDLNSNSGAVILSGNAIDGTAGSITGGSLSAEINNAPASGQPQRDDAGLLGALCVEGNICLGSVSADNRIEIGQNSNNDVIQLIVEQATVSANDVLITIRNDIVMGSNGIPTAITAANTFAVESLTGDVNLLDAVINSNQITVAAAGSLIGSGSLTSANDIGITVGRDLNALLIDTGGQLTTAASVGGAPEAEYTVLGAINVGTYTQGAAAPLRVVADAGINFGAINVAASQDISLIAGNVAAGDVFLGSASGAGNIVLSGDNIGFGNLAAAAAITASTAGSIIGGDLNAGTTLDLNGGSVTIGNASAATILIASATDIVFDSLAALNPISLSAVNGIIAGNTAAGDIDSDGDIDLAALVISLGNVTSGGSVSAVATAGDASFGIVAAANDITISATGTPSLTNAISGGSTSITGTSVSFANGTIGGDLLLTATTGDINAIGTASVAGGIALNASGDIALSSLTAAGGNFTADAGGAIAFTDAAASGILNFNAVGSIIGSGSVNAGGIILRSGDVISVPQVISGSFIDIFGQNRITIGSLTGGTAFLQAATGAILVTDEIDMTGLLEAVGQSVFLRSTNGLTVQATSSAGGIDIAVAGDLDLRGLTAAGNISLTTTGGSIIANQAVTGGPTALPPGAQGTLQITSSGGNVDITAANNFTVNSAVSAANGLTINVGGTIDLQAEATGATIDVRAGDINIGSAGSLGRSDLTGSIVITSRGDIRLGGAAGGSPTSGLMQVDNTEFSQIFSGGDLAFNALVNAAGTGGNITVDTLDVLVGSAAGTPQAGNIGQNGTLFLNATGAINVIGIAKMTNAGANNFFALSAGQFIQVDTDTGALLVQDANGGLAGTLELVAPTIRAISDAAAGDIDGATIADIDIRLGQNDGAINDIGYFAAGDLFFSVDDALLIQNSGSDSAFIDRRGFTANNITIDSVTSGAVIVINGTVGGLTGVDALASVGVPTLFDPGSTINGCLIVNSAACFANFDDPGLRNPIQDLIDEEIDPTDDEKPGVGEDPEDDLGGILVEMREPTSMREDPLLDDPVTGAGNEDFWVSGPDCDGVDADSEACAAAGETEPAE
jgi:hypothetical protein